MSSDTLWDLDSHSIGKHLVLDRYIKGWFPILSRVTRSKNLLVIDGFSGPGEYSNGYSGSPVILLDALLEHCDGYLKDVNTTFVFIEKDEARLTHLQELVSKKYEMLPTSITLKFINSSFKESIKDLFLIIKHRQKDQSPSFTLIDPFGIKDTPMHLIDAILQNDKAEVYISWMYEFINRFKGTSEFKPHLNGLFGSEAWIDCLDISDKNERREFLTGLYKNSLKKSNPEHQVVHFELMKGKRHVYSIFFVSKSSAGTNLMKEAIWKHVPEGDFRYQGDIGLELNIAVPDYSPLIDSIVNEFKGRWVTSKDIQWFVASDKTQYHKAQVKKYALKVLEEQGRIKVDPAYNRSRRYTYPDAMRLNITH